jgi:hypothetical protein
MSTLALLASLLNAGAFLIAFCNQVPYPSWQLAGTPKRVSLSLIFATLKKATLRP